MQTRAISRRGLLRGLTLLGGGAILAACAPKAGPTPAPTTAQGAATAAPKAPAAKPKVSIRIQTPARPNTIPMMNQTIEWFKESHPEIEVLSEETIYGEISKKTEIGYASGTLQDVLYGHHRWYAYGCYMGFYGPIDSYIEKSPPPDFGDFFPGPMEANKFEGKQYSLPHFVHPGSNILIIYNKNILAEAGVPEPKRDWKYSDLVEMATKCTNKAKGIFGVSWTVTDFHKYGQYTRSWGEPTLADKSGWLLSEDGKTFRFLETKEAAQLYIDLLKAGVAPKPSDEIPGTLGLRGAGRQAFWGDQIQGVVTAQNTVKGAFEIGYQLRPLGPKGRESTCTECNMWMIHSKTKHADACWEFMKALTSKESAIFGILSGGLQPARRSAWLDPQVVAKFPAYKDGAEALAKPLEPFPMPYNLRFVEANDVFNNEAAPIWSLEKTWDEQAPIVQKKVQQILDMERPKRT